MEQPKLPPKPEATNWHDLMGPEFDVVDAAEVAGYGRQCYEAGVAAERERCAAIADDEARIREAAGKTHPEESEERGRCFAGARAAANVARGIRNGEVVASAIRKGEAP